MTTKAIKKKRDEGMLRDDWQPVNERAPSIIRTDQPTPGRIIAFVSMLLLVVGGLAAILHAAGNRSVLALLIGLGWGIFFVMLGFAGLLYHAFTEREAGYRRLYGVLGGILLAVGVAFRLLPFRVGEGETATMEMGARFIGLGAPALLLSLCFLLGFIRYETDQPRRDFVSRVIGIAGILLIGVGFIGSLFYAEFLLGSGFIHLVLGLLFAAAFVGVESPNSVRGYRAGIALGVVGGVMLLIALGRGLPLTNTAGLSWISWIFGWVRWPPQFQPAAPFLFGYLGVEYLLLSVGICSDRQFVVMTRRELGAFFFSPIAYIVLIALVILGGWSFLLFVSQISDPRITMMRGGIPEPIVQHYFITLLPVICAILLVPVITMRLLSEEQRSGTLEVLLTAPVKESTVVLSKFVAALRFFMLAWYPWVVYLVAMWAETNTPFDYRPVLSFLIVLLATGAGFVALGLFFSSVTKNQIIAAMLSLMAMIVLLALFLVKESELTSPGGFWNGLLNYISFIDLWWNAARGMLAPRLLVFHISFAIFFIFLTIKVLESRKWR
jgi:ABC-type transport system involved in multi-copper enzyme maturation permease subunit